MRRKGWEKRRLSVSAWPSCSADLQSAVSPNCIRQSVGSVPRAGVPQHLAEWNSALQQSTTLRYDDSYRSGARMCLARPLPVAQTFLSAAFWGLESPQAIEEHGAGKHRELADRNVRATPLTTYGGGRLQQWPCS